MKTETFDEKIARLQESVNEIRDREELENIAKDAITNGWYPMAVVLCNALNDEDCEYFRYDASMGSLDTPTPLETLDDLSDWE